MAALDLGPGKRILSIASGGCNVMSYLTASPAGISAVDLNPAHVALVKLKIAAIQYLPDYDRYIRDRLDPMTHAYWEHKRFGTGRRINVFARNVYRYGLLGRFIGTVHFLARAYGKNPRKMLTATSLDEQRRLFNETLAPMFDTKLVRLMCRLPVSLYGLGIPPAQFAYLNAQAHGNVAGLLKDRLERLACDFPMGDNYFAWQAFGRGYDKADRVAVPRHLARRHYETVKAHVDRVEIEHASFTTRLGREPRDGYVLLDAQDWMSHAQMAELWAEITRTAKPGARVIFRTAGDESPLETALPAEICPRWTYDPAACRAYVAKDRSSIYGGFHLYQLNVPGETGA